MRTTLLVDKELLDEAGRYAGELEIYAVDSYFERVSGLRLHW
jgi:hypothetical protein